MMSFISSPNVGNMAMVMAMGGTRTKEENAFFAANREKVYNSMRKVNQQFANTTRANFVSASVQAEAKQVLQQTVGLVNHDLISAVNRNTILTTGYKNRKYIMSHPEMYRLHIENECSSYGGLWVDDTEDIKEDMSDDDITWRKDYLDVVDGFSVDGMVTHCYSTEDSALDVQDQLTVLNNWEVVDEMLEEGLDPSNELGERL